MYMRSLYFNFYCRLHASEYLLVLMKWPFHFYLAAVACRDFSFEHFLSNIYFAIYISYIYSLLIFYNRFITLESWNNHVLKFI